MNKCQIFYDIFSKHYDFVGRSHGFKLNTDEKKRTRMTLITRILKGHTDHTDHTDLKLFFSDFVIDFSKILSVATMSTTQGRPNCRTRMTRMNTDGRKNACTTEAAQAFILASEKP